jgi:DNA-binding transcriptional MerR regulator
MSTLYRIGEFARLCGVSAKTLRFYDEAGILHPASVDLRTGYRRYGPAQLEQMASIIALKNLGVPLSRVGEFTSKGGSSAERRAMLRELERRLELTVKTATQSLAWVTAALQDLDSGRQPISVIVKRRSAVPVAARRVTVRNYAEVEGFEKDLLRALPRDSMGTLRGVLWHRCADSESLEAEPFVELKKRVAYSRNYDIKELSEATLACAYSDTTDESAQLCYCAVRDWMQMRGLHLAGPKREIYLQGLLEIQFPLDG